MQERFTTAVEPRDMAGKADRDATPTEAILERLAEDLEKTQHVFSQLESRIESCLSNAAPPATDDRAKPGLESVAGSRLEERLQRIRNQAQGLTERMVRVIDRVRL